MLKAREVGLQCLSAVWPLGPLKHVVKLYVDAAVSNAFRLCGLWGRRAARSTTGWTQGVSPMPFGCVAFGAIDVITSNLKNGNGSPMPFGCVAFGAETKETEYESAHLGLQCLSAVWPLGPTQRQLGVHLLRH